MNQSAAASRNRLMLPATMARDGPRFHFVVGCGVVVRPAASFGLSFVAPWIVDDVFGLLNLLRRLFAAKRKDTDKNFKEAHLVE